MTTSTPFASRSTKGQTRMYRKACRACGGPKNVPLLRGAFHLTRDDGSTVLPDEVASAVGPNVVPGPAPAGIPTKPREIEWWKNPNDGTWVSVSHQDSSGVALFTIEPNGKSRRYGLHNYAGVILKGTLKECKARAQQLADALGRAALEPIGA